MWAEGVGKDSEDRQSLDLLFEVPFVDRRNNLLTCVNFLQYLSMTTKKWKGVMLYPQDSDRCTP